MPKLGLQVERGPAEGAPSCEGAGATCDDPQTILLARAASLLLLSQQQTKLKAGELDPISSLNCNYCPFFFFYNLSVCQSVCLSVSETGSQVALNSLCTKDDLERLPLGPPLPECWDYRQVLLHLVYACQESNLCLLGSPLTTELHSQHFLSLSMNIS